MALKNSKTGSLPVSEIYSFMKEHFPYFKVMSYRTRQCVCVLNRTDLVEILHGFNSLGRSDGTGRLEELRAAQPVSE